MAQAIINSWLNGKPTKVVDIRDRGFLYGDGFFSTAVLKDSEIKLYDYHIARICRHAKALNIQCDFDKIEKDLAKFISGHESGLVKIIITRGLGERGYYAPGADDASFREENIPITNNCYFQLFADERSDLVWERREKGIELFLTETRLAINPQFAGLKHLNRLEQVMARSEQSPVRFPEGLMRDANGVVVEGTMSNLFCVKDACVFTPLLDQCGVEGVMKANIIAYLKLQNVEVVQKHLTLEEVLSADELFVCNAIIGIWPVIKIGEKEWFPGKCANQLLQDKVFLARSGF